MDTELLKTFLEVEKTRHIGRAAENLYLTPAAVSARIKQLEGIDGIPLLIRGKNKMGLTPAGEKLKPRAAEVLEALTRAIQEPNTRATARHEFSIGGSPNLWDCIVSDWLCEAQRNQPDLSFRADCHDSGYLITQLQSRQLDMAFMFDPLALEGLCCEKVAALEFGLAAPGPSVSVESVAQGNYVLVDWCVGFGIEHSRVVGDRWAPTLVASTGRVALKYLAAFGGAGFFPTSWCDSPPLEIALHPVAGIAPITLDLYVLFSASNRNRPKIESLLALF